MTDLTQLLELAEKATPGPWTWINSNMSQNRAGRLFAEDLVLDADPGIFCDMKDARYIAAANPKTITAILTQALKDQELVKEAVEMATNIKYQLNNPAEGGDYPRKRLHECRMMASDFLKKVNDGK